MTYMDIIDNLRPPLTILSNKLSYVRFDVFEQTLADYCKQGESMKTNQVKPCKKHCKIN